MSKKIGGVVALVGLCALSLFLVNCGSSSSRPTGLLYVLTQGNNGVGNSVSSFAIDLNNGSLSLINLNASTCPTAGACGAPLNIVLDPTGKVAFVLNQGIPCVKQNTQCIPTTNSPIVPSIFPYTVNSDGSLSAPGSAVNWTCINVPAPCPSLPTQTMPSPVGYDTAVAMALDAAGQFLFVIDEGVSPSPTNCPPAGTPNPSDPMYVGCPSITVFSASPGSTTLTAASGSPFYLSKIPTALSTITFTPPGGSAQELLFVSNNQDICTQGCNPLHNDNTVSVYGVSSTGSLTERTGSPYTVAAANPVSVLAVNTNPGQNTGGIFVYVGNNAQTGGDITPFQICTVQNQVCGAQQVAQNLMVPVPCLQVSCAVAAGQDPAAMVIDPTNNYLYVASQVSNQVYGFRISTSVGTLTPLSPASQSTGSQPAALAMHPSVFSTGEFLYVSNSNSSNITGYSITTTTGGMSNPITVISNPSPTGMAAR